MKLNEVLSRAWIECDPNRAGAEPGSGFHPDDSIQPGLDSEGKETTTELTGQPYWKWFEPRAEALQHYLQKHGHTIIPAA